MNIILLCGGKGLRLRPLTENLPKPLAKLNGKPILHYVLNHLKGFDVKKVTVSVGYQSQKIIDYLSSQKLPWKNEISNAGDVDIIFRIIKALENDDDDEEFIVLYGDTISDVNLNTLRNFHCNHNRPITISTWPLKLQFGIVGIDEKSNVVDFREKPKSDIWINIGYIFFDKYILKELKDFKTFESFLISMSKKNKIAAYKHFGEHVTINSLKELKEAEMYLEKREES
jgi:glucose-1-phosphate cytidylyltransferase